LLDKSDRFSLFLTIFLQNCIIHKFWQIFKFCEIFWNTALTIDRKRFLYFQKSECFDENKRRSFSPTFSEKVSKSWTKWYLVILPYHPPWCPRSRASFHQKWTTFSFSWRAENVGKFGGFSIFSEMLRLKVGVILENVGIFKGKLDMRYLKKLVITKCTKIINFVHCLWYFMKK
jgi:hypothetical protein